jgi:hypothetical protein
MEEVHNDGCMEQIEMPSNTASVFGRDGIMAFDDGNNEAKNRDTLGASVAGFISRLVIVGFRIERIIWLCFDWVGRQLPRRPTAS